MTHILELLVGKNSLLVYLFSIPDHICVSGEVNNRKICVVESAATGIEAEDTNIPIVLSVGGVALLCVVFVGIALFVKKPSKNGSNMRATNAMFNDPNESTVLEPISKHQASRNSKGGMGSFEEVSV